MPPFWTRPVERPLHRKRTVYRFRPLDGRGPLFGVEESTVLNEFEGAKTTLVKTIHVAGCGHVVGTRDASELGGRCSVCRTALCIECSSLLRCRRCLGVVCTRCHKIVDRELFCSRCWPIVVGGRVAAKALRGLHGFLGKDFS